MAESILPQPESALLHWEIERMYTREVVTIAAGQDLPAGAVLGRITASGEYAAHDAAATDGTENVAGVLIEPVDAQAGAQAGLVLARGPAVVLDRALDWNGQAGAAVEAGKDGLLALGIVVR